MAITNGGLLNSTPSVTKQALQSNYLDLANSSNAGWSQQYIPDLMEREAEVFGPRTISGFLSKVGAEEAMQADQVVWSEQGRLHLSYTGQVTAGASGTVAGGQITLAKDIDGNDLSGNEHGIRVNDTVIVASSEAVAKCIVTKTNVGSSYVIEVAPYGAATLNAAGFTDNQGANSVTVLVYGCLLYTSPSQRD